MLNKDNSIIYVVDYLKRKFGKTEILVKDHWEADLCAIGLTDKSGQYLIYISTFGKSKGQYFVSLESPAVNKDLPNNPNDDHDHQSLEELEAKLTAHFKLM